MTEARNPRRLGTAEWADPDEVAKNLRFSTGNFWLGRLPTDGTPVGYADDRHICLVSGSRAGKGTSAIIPNLCLWPGSLVCVDPKGENATVTAARRGPGSPHCEGLGQAVHVLDPFNAATVDPALRARFNPLDALDPDDEESIDEAGRIADAIVVINPESKDPFWDESGRALVKALILHVLTAPYFEGRRTLLTVRELILRGDVQTVEKLQAMGEPEIASAQALLWEGVRSNPAMAGVIAGAGDTFGNMARNSPKQFESVLQVANRNTEFIDSPGMRRCLEASDFKLSDLKTQKAGVSLYLSLPQRYMSTHYRWLRMMIALTVTEMERVRQQPASGHRVLMCLDEFAGLKRMEVIENAVAQIAGNGVKLMFVLQSLEQLKATYKEKWETFLSNCGIKVFFGIEDHFTREYVSKFIGETEIVRETRTSSEADSTNESRTQTTANSRTTTSSETRTKQSSTSRSKSGGTNDSRSSGSGTSGGQSWKRGIFGGRNDKQFNEGTNSNSGQTSGRNSGWSVGTTSGIAQAMGFSVAEGTTVSDGNTTGSSQTSTRGVNEGIHKRALVTPDEIGGLFRRLDDPSHPAYPGLALALISGQSPLALQRVHYYADGYFQKQFDPHPDYPQLATWLEIEVGPSDRAMTYYISPSASKVKYQVHVVEGGTVRKGDPVVTIDCRGFQWSSANDVPYYSRQKFLKPSAGHQRVLTPLEVVVRAPVTGYVSRVGSGDPGRDRLYSMMGIDKRTSNDEHDRQWRFLTAAVISADTPDKRIADENHRDLLVQCKQYRAVWREEQARRYVFGLGGSIALGLTFLLLLAVSLEARNWIMSGVFLIGALNCWRFFSETRQDIQYYEKRIKECPAPDDE